jgi:hypothetical protein
MLATAFSDITYVMVTGHIIAFLTITWMQKSVLAKILEQHDFAVNIARNTKESSPQPEVAVVITEPIDTTESTKETVALLDEIEVQWDGAVGPSISDDVEWSDVIELKD